MQLHRRGVSLSIINNTSVSLIMFVQFVWLLQLIGVATGRRGGSRCHERGCTTRSSFDTAGSRNAMLYSKLARQGMLNVNNKICIHPCAARRRVSARPAAGTWNSAPSTQTPSEEMRAPRVRHAAELCMVGSRKVEFCFKHAKEGMINVKSKK